MSFSFRLFRKSIFGAADEVELKFMNRYYLILEVMLVPFACNICLTKFALLLGGTMKT